MAYSKTVWENNHSPKINATNLNHIEDGIETVDTNVGDLTDLETTEQGDVVGAVNEVNTKAEELKSFLDLSNTITYSGSDMSSSNGTVQSYSSVTIRYNDDGTLMEMSGTIYNNHSTTGEAQVTLPNTPLRPTAERTVSSAVALYSNTVIGESIKIGTNGTIVFSLYGTASANSRHTIIPTMNIMM